MKKLDTVIQAAKAAGDGMTDTEHRASRSARQKRRIETVVHGIFLLLGLVTIACVGMITVYLVVSGIPAIREIGLVPFLFGTSWESTAADPKFGILPFILTSVYGTAGAVVLGVPIGFLVAVYLAKIARPRVKSLVCGAVGVLAGIPSVVYGLVGMMVLVCRASGSCSACPTEPASWPPSWCWPL